MDFSPILAERSPTRKMMMVMRVTILRGSYVFLLLGVSLVARAQISPVTVGVSRAEIKQRLTANEDGIRYEVIQESDNELQVLYADEIGYESKVICDFEDGLCEKTLAEWKATHPDYRVILRKWFDEVVSMLDDESAYERDPLMEERLRGSFNEGNSNVAVFVTSLQSERIILVFHARNDESFLSQMHQVYFWPEELEE